MKVIGLLLFLVGAFWIAFELRRLRRLVEDKNQEIDLLERRATEFVANVSHELKTPLTSIQGFAETLRNGAIRDPKTADEFLKRIEDNSARLTDIVNDILELAKIEAKNVYLESESFNPVDVIKEIEKDFEFLMKQRRQKIVIRPSVNEIFADRKLFKTALRNLVENAHRYCPEGAQIEFQAVEVIEQGREFNKVSVNDNGPGIGVEDLPRIFERFYRADKSRNRASGGTGLGLAIVKHIMLSHGGFVRAISEPLKGASFSLFFPTSSRAASRQKPSLIAT